MADVVATQERTGKGLENGALGLWGNVTIGLASTAPAYSLAATLGYVVLAVDDKAPAMFILAFIPMLLVAVAYRELNRAAAGLRHHLHLGDQGVRSVGRLARRLGGRRVGDHRAGQCRRDRRHLPAALPRPGRAGREQAGQGAASAWSSSP